MSALFDRQRTTFFCSGVRGVTPLFAPCAPLLLVLCAPCAFPVVLCSPRVVPDAAPYQSFGPSVVGVAGVVLVWLQQVTPSELQARPQVQTQPRIQKEQERFDDRPASVPNVHPCQAPGLLPFFTSHKFQRACIDPNQPDRGEKSISRTTIAPLAMPI